ncbi:hypothetical protein ALP33_01200 [Pseudomonas amygdali pv. lachrymans]|uniref:Uncharacterized protein n=1 Tax=Pseudomonas amygdali pv. lachrymans TaxID=53707 RepID=A0AB37RAI9_PSEAV|nr:hypothetical protein [Pseudomonas amygdali]RMU22193.1 hypothetical protein ALP33_01200 [Pseudomonas amygdali pv. lachrymans]
MPITAFSSSRGMELDVDQLLSRLSEETAQSELGKSQAIPEAWKTHIASDLECPSCFQYGAEVVRAGRSKTDGQVVRQAYFRFAKSGAGTGHHPFCDFAGNVPTGHIPENLVMFSTAKDGVSRAVRELVCKGIALQVFEQRDIRAMREWFFQQKLESQFVVTLDPQLPGWLESLRHQGHWYSRRPLQGFALSDAVLRMPNFDFKAAARSELSLTYQPILKQLFEKKIFLHGVASRIEKMASDYQGKSVFDPTTLSEHYDLTQNFAEFICINHAPLARLGKTYSPLAGLKNTKYLLAFAALLLFVSGWQPTAAADKFAKIVSNNMPVDQTLGNVMGLNPFHDFESWETLKLLQGLTDIEVPAMTIKQEQEAWIEDARRRAGLQSIL